MKPRINTNPVANQYTGRSNQRIIEFTDPNTGKGGLMSFTSKDDGTLSIHVYRQDPGVVVTVAPAEDPGRAGITLTRDQLEAWAGRRLTDDEVKALDDMIPNSSIPEAVGTIVASCLGGFPEEPLDAADIPEDFPVRPLRPGEPAGTVATCGECGLSWDDSISTSYTPTPAGRCPFEYFHKEG